MVKEADKFMQAASLKYPNLEIKPEAGASMIEIGAYTDVNVLHTVIDLMEKIKMLIDIADSNDYVLYPLATYPGNIEAEITNKRWYKEQAIILGEEQYLNATLCCGFHYHYTLPRGVFDPKTKFLKSMVKSKIKQSLIDSYNLSIAMDPAITHLLQSSPFVQGKYIAKDSRMLMYRGGKKLNYIKGKYGKYQALGALPPYKQTLNDLMFSLKRRQEKWEDLMIKHDLDPSWLIKRDNILAFTWNPVRINKIGTLEIRSPDMNHPKYLMALAALMKFIFRKIYRDFYKVMPSDIGLEEPFKVEGDIIYIPPHTHVRNVLQKESAYKGFESRNMKQYTKRFYRFARQFLDKNYVDVVKPLYRLMEDEESVSDILIKRFKKMGYGKKDDIPNEDAAEASLKSCERLLKEVDETEEKLYKAYNVEPRKKSS
jgi:carboxylate-amine ligase